MISLYHPGHTWLHDMPAGWKLLLLALASLFLVPLQQVMILSGALAGTLLLYASLRPAGLHRLSMIRPLAPLLLVIFLFHGLTGDWRLGAVVVLRLSVLVLLANLVTLTTRMDDLLGAIQPLFAPLRLVGISPRVPALAIVLVIRFVPVLRGIQLALAEAWRARAGGRVGWQILMPLIVQALIMSDQVAEALTARGGAAGFQEAAPGNGRTERIG